MRSKRVPWSTLTNSASQALRSSSSEVERSSDAATALGASTCFLQYLMTLERILLVTFGSGMPLSAQSSSIWWALSGTASSDFELCPWVGVADGGGGGDEMGKGGARGLSPTVLVGAGLWVVPLSRSHLSLSATPSEEMK
ncbi:hypothetical protein FH972_012065 [Carpinus fangiana]|uniref:Uncharacterized protein n=1 Tax=Carpinus fangiana TaxID=176857 RepID=A0A5N6R5L9_9ROSI|nr:hypothetical protein FH972_012065 [Carpinus fangiana]